MTPGPRPLTPIPTSSYTLPFRWPNYLIPSIPFLRKAPKIPLLDQEVRSEQQQQQQQDESAAASSPTLLDHGQAYDDDDSASYSSYDSAITSPLSEHSSSNGEAFGDSDSGSSSTSSDDEEFSETNDGDTPPRPREQNYLYGSTSVLKCRRCQTDICFSETIISKGFNGRHGRAYLCNPLAPHTHTLAKPTTRQLVTGTHLVADISCSVCLNTLGWKYISASDPFQHYKIGKFILETKRVIRVTHWQAHEVPHPQADSEKPFDPTVSNSAHKYHPPPNSMWDLDNDTGRRELAQAEEWGDVNSEDEDELEDMFLGKWTPKLAAKRRKIWEKEVERRNARVKEVMEGNMS
ncbi:yippee zinc-binding/DNA-binding /Mis18, centromere assembly-domain-containing protein [Kalaharituber pfeilii]|nr:yippee zinc-binding/DNA-binding /Mis18, centromere assembly-domain-containing protein [Kalaharituber pfeilii]